MNEGIVYDLTRPAMPKLVKAGDVVSIGSTNKTNQSGWQISLMRDAERQTIAALNRHLRPAR